MAYTILSYSPKRTAERKDVPIEKAPKLRDSVVWIDVTNPGREELERLQKAYGLHHLAIDDCLHDIQRPKIEVYDDYFFVVARSITYDEGIRTRQISIFVGKNYLISVHKDELDFLEDVRKRILEGGHRVNMYGPDYLLYKIIDAIVDNYFKILEKVESEIEVIERKVVARPTRSILESIFKTKKDLLLMRKPVWPLREVLHLLQSGSIETVSDASRPYFRDIYDHVINIIDLLETYRELVTTSLETYLSSVSNSLNEVVKVLTVLTSLFMIPMLIASIYGMNFRNMPEISWQYGYLFSLVLMATAIALTYLYFRNKRWV